MFFPAAAILLAYWFVILGGSAAPLVSVLTQHNDNGRTGRNINEQILNTSNVNTNTFGLVAVRPVDDQIYAQPLVMTNVTIPGQGTHNVVYVCTVNDSVYAFDADAPSMVAPYWHVNFLSSSNGTNVAPPRNTDMAGACGGFYPNFSGAFGIVSTPVIDPVAGTLFLVARTKEMTSSATNYVQKLHALDINTGAERSGSPAIIKGTFPGTASDGSGGIVTFNPYMENQRAGLLLVNGVIYIAWASHCDWTPYHGWVMAYSASTLQQLAVYNDTPNGTEGGIWMSGQAPAADGSGNIYLATGNGTADTSGTVNRGQSFLKMSLTGTNLTIVSWFTPYNFTNLNNKDLDIGSGGVILIPGTSLLMGGGKAGVAYLVKQNTLGGFSHTNSDTNIVQSFQVTSNEIHGAPVWWDGPNASYAYIWPATVYLQQYQFNTGTGTFNMPAFAQSPTIAAPGEPGGILAVSANGTNAGTGILWAAVQLDGSANPAVRAGILHAYDAENVTHELWNSQQLSARDDVGNFAKFVPPTIANGKVYLATFSDRLNIYGLLAATAPVILLQPQPATLFAGDSVTFSIWAGGTIPAPSYQWFDGPNPIPGATGSTYTIGGVQFSNVGNYNCTVSNIYGAVSSSNAALNVISAPTITYAEVVMADNPVAYWRLDETNGSVAHDYWGGFNGVYSNVNLGLPGYNALDPDLAAGFGTLSRSNSFVGNIGVDFASVDPVALSVEAWVKGPSQAAGSGIVAKGTGNGGEQFCLDTGAPSQCFRFFVRDDGGATHNANSAIAPDGGWHHLVGVCDEVKGTVTIYVDGLVNGTGTVSNGLHSTQFPASIGSRTSSQSAPYDLNFAGTIDEVAVYNYALSASAVQLHHRVGINGPVSLTARPSAGNVALTWPIGALQAATAVTGPYTNVPGAASPWTNSASNPAQFYRLKVR
jgi:hypothetical protein